MNSFVLNDTTLIEWAARSSPKVRENPFYVPISTMLTADASQALMRLKSYTTTKRYINMAKQLDQAVSGLKVPDEVRKAFSE